ncbi:FUSC family protein [Bordetella trematum]|uniref:FUSC family protein n=1 Tax=Bordetella trematum TaxID=123899 RepID=UPI000DA02FDA|nr:FUSC family protein [Bordetella trematum]SPU50573.1 multidrug efflux protein [Bordetella trematum]VDH06813.1 p-hydroxybenzoic acid efflux pump subunit AaeB [Bordetella trematum]
MKASQALFSLKCFTGAMAALYLSYRMGLPRPFWAMTTAYIVSQPWSGAVRSKAVYRLGGTLFGSAMMVYALPRLANAPALMLLAIAAWVAGCLYLAVLDRTPRSYLFMLAGYTAAMIGLPTVTQPGDVFDTALARVEEISLGIVCATLVHSLVLPQGIAGPLLGRLDATLRDARQWVLDVIKPGRDDGGAKGAQDRRSLANDITQLRLLATHVPFDTGNIRWTADALRAMQDHITALTPLVSAVEDRLRAWQAEGQALPSPLAAVMDDIAAWMADGPRASRSQATPLCERLNALCASFAPDWRGALLTSLAVRLRELVQGYAACLALRANIGRGLNGLPAAPVKRLTRGPALHRDHGLALRSALAAALAILVCGAFWIGTAWSNGAVATLMAAIFSSFFAAQDDPVPGIMQFLVYSIYSIPLSALYLLGVMPAVHSFEMLALALFPVAFITGLYLTNPATTGKAMAVFFGLSGTLALHDTHTADLVSFVDTTLAQCIGVALAAIIAAIFRSVSVDWSAQRLQRANWRDLARLADDPRRARSPSVDARLLDRIGLLQPRLAISRHAHDNLADDALQDLRVGRDIAELQQASRDLPDAGIILPPVLQGLAELFRQRLEQPRATQPAALLTHIDRALQTLWRQARSAPAERALVALVGIRRSLYPDAAAPRKVHA